MKPNIRLRTLLVFVSALVPLAGSAQPVVPVAAPAGPAQPAAANAASPPPAASAAPAARPADAPPLVALTKARDGNFRIAPPWTKDPAFVEKPGVPKGKVVQLTMSSDDSKVFPTVAGRNGQAQAFQRPVEVYTPAGYVPGTPAPFIVVQDGTSWYATNASQKRPTNDLPCIPTMLDNLIAEKRVPAMVAILINPGQNRSLEYDTVSDRYTMFIENEVLPKITKDYGIAFTKDPEGRATFGESSGSAAAIAMAWFHPELYRRVISYSGTFVALQRNAETAPHGAWEYHENLIPKSDRKPMRIWLQVGEKDNGSTTPAESMRNWVIANERMADVLKDKGYHYQYVFSETVGHVSRAVQLQTMPEAFEWAWQGYPIK
jgi:enterochelin esterase family protein